MVREEILEGLREAVIRGEPLRKAMMSFYNAGYKKQEIEEAARVLNAMPLQQRMPQPTTQPRQQVASFQPSHEEPDKAKETKEPAQPVQTQPQPIQQQPMPQQPVQPVQVQPIPLQQPMQPVQYPYPVQYIDPRFQPPANVLQRVSQYGQKPSVTNLVITFVLVFFLLFLLGLLVAVFLFRNELSSLFGNLF